MMDKAKAQAQKKPHNHKAGTNKPVAVTQPDSVLSIIQTKLKIGQADDQYEQEADRVADQVMRMPETVEETKPPVPNTTNITLPQKGSLDTDIQCQPEETEEEELLQAKRQPSPAPRVNHQLEASIRSLQSGGQLLPKSTRGFFETRFGTDFSDVRIHHDDQAAKTAQSINARAFTLGQHISFAKGEYLPETSSGRHLLAHELTHVLQQKGKDRIQPLVNNSVPATEIMTQRSPARGANPVSHPHANREMAPQKLNITGLEDEQRIQRDDDVPPATAPTLASPKLNFGATGSTLTRGDTLTASVDFTANAGETLTVTQWTYTTSAHGTVTRATTDANFQSSWSGTMAVSGELAMQYTLTPAGGSAGSVQTLSETITVNDRTGANWVSAVTNAAEGVLSGKPSPPRVFSDLGHHATATSQPNPTTSSISSGPNNGFTYVSAMNAGTYTSTPTIHPDLTAATSTFKTFHSNPSILLFVVGTSKTRIPNTEYSGLSVSGSLTFTVPDWEAFYKLHNFYRVRATASTGGRTVTVQNTWWGLASNAENAQISITNDAALRTALAGGSGSYSGAYSVSATPRGSWEGFELMQAAAILTGTRSHEYVHATHSHRANFTKMLTALDPRKVLERKVSAPGHAINFNTTTRTLIREILRPNHEIVDQAASAAAESFVAQPGVTMAGVNEDPANGSNLGTVWNIHADRGMTN